ncbi:unnamed protein product [Brassica rapa subsp. trilocularis]
MYAEPSARKAGHQSANKRTVATGIPAHLSTTRPHMQISYFGSYVLSGIKISTT